MTKLTWYPLSHRLRGFGDKIVVDYADLVTAYSLTILTHVGIVFGYPDTMAILRPSVRVVNDYAHDEDKIFTLKMKKLMFK